MALNVKAAMMICAGCIAGMSWLLQQAEVREVAVASPLVAAEGPLRATLGGKVKVDEWAAPVEAVEWRAELAGRFERSNALTEQVLVNRAAEVSLAVAAAPESGPRTVPALRLPPLVDPFSGQPDWTADLADAGAGDDLVVASAAEPFLDEMAAAGGPDDTDGVEAPEELRPVLRRHVVARGETLTRIARRECAVDDPRMVELLMEMNPKVLARDGHVLAGETLVIPERESAQRLMALLESGEVDQAGIVAVACAGGDARGTSTDVRWYTIKRDDSLTSIAERFLADGDRWREILKLNRKLRPNKIYPGVRIKLPPLVRMAQG